MEEGRGKE